MLKSHFFRFKFTFLLFRSKFTSLWTKLWNEKTGKVIITEDIISPAAGLVLDYLKAFSRWMHLYKFKFLRLDQLRCRIGILFWSRELLDFLISFIKHQKMIVLLFPSLARWQKHIRTQKEWCDFSVIWCGFRALVHVRNRHQNAT